MRRFAVLLACATLLLAMSIASASAGTSVVTRDASATAVIVTMAEPSDKRHAIFFTNSRLISRNSAPLT